MNPLGTLLHYNIKPRYKTPCFSQYVVISDTGILKKVTGKNRAIKSQGVKAVYVKPRKNAKLTPPMSMGDRYAYVIATGDSEEDAKQNAKHAASQINFSLSPIILEDNTNKKDSNVDYHWPVFEKKWSNL